MLGRLSCQVPGAPGAPKSFDLCRLQAASPNGSVSVGRGGGVDVACDAPRGDFRVVSKAHAQLKLLADGHLQVPAHFHSAPAVRCPPGQRPRPRGGTHKCTRSTHQTPAPRQQRTASTPPPGGSV